MNKIFCFSLLCIFIASCAPRIAYIGETYAPTFDVDLYYDEKDIEKDYITIGLARNEGDEMERDDLQSIRNQMIKKAREVGADAILFVTIGRNTGSGDFDFDSNKIIEAKFLRYK